MPSLPDELFSLLETKTLKARETAEKGARNIITYLKVESNTWWGEKDDPQRSLWLGLRARARQLGYGLEQNDEKDPVKLGLPQLMEEIAYEQWHRMLFARFLTENHLLMHPKGVAVSLAECEELAQEEGEEDAWRLAALYASNMLPGVFKQEDPCAQVHLTLSDHHTLENILLEIPALVFTCDDSLGWMYQFWQSKKKDEVNASERKIGGADLSPVTQLFTEDYMVRFLLENSLGAWWAAHHPDSPLIKEWKYLRFNENGTPSVGFFPGWPKCACDVTLMDPCCGSGHFLVAAFTMLVSIRAEEEGLSDLAAGDAVLHDNLFGLELDPRCAQIAAFSLVLAAWKCGGYRPLDVPNIACTGIPVQGQLEAWIKLAGKDSRIRAGLEHLYGLFKNAPDLGSLINPVDLPDADRMFVADYEQVAPAFELALSMEPKSDDLAVDVFEVAVEGVTKAARLLARKYTLVTTNVPYLGRGKQDGQLKQFCDLDYPLSKADLATVFVERCRKFTQSEGSYAVVVPQNWLFLSSYKLLRHKLLKEQRWNIVARLGSGAFGTISGEVVNVALIVITNNNYDPNSTFLGIDVSMKNGIQEKANSLTNLALDPVLQSLQLKNPDYKIVLSSLGIGQPLKKFAKVYEGMHSGDYPRFGRKFWEINIVNHGWVLQQSAPDHTDNYAGRENILLWENGNGVLMQFVKERLQSETVSLWIKGYSAWGKKGVAVSTMSNLKATLYSGEIFTHGAIVIIPNQIEQLAALWTYCQSSEFLTNIRKLDQKVSVARATFDEIPFDIERWQNVANESKSLPDPFTEDPTQWLFQGQINCSTAPLQVAVAHLMGYRWPQQDENPLEPFNDSDGIACLPAVIREALAAERLRILLAIGYGSEWSGTKQEELLAAVGCSGNELADWLRDSFFEQHCQLFQNRPFILHIWDGRKDGFSALVNYHKLDRSNLEKLTYTYLGTWIIDRKKDIEKGVAGAEGRLLAAQTLQDKLKLILAGEPPYDIFIRWKPLHEQSIGWEPDLNDGVRLNIRPFVTAGVLRSKFTVNWNKDRGKNPDGSERMNDLHFSIAEKQAAREKQRKLEL